MHKIAVQSRLVEIYAFYHIFACYGCQCHPSYLYGSEQYEGPKKSR